MGYFYHGLLDHPNICTVHEIEEVEGKTFIVMAFLEGQTVKDELKERPLKLEEALDIAVQTAAGLQAAHEKKPETGPETGTAPVSSFRTSESTATTVPTAFRRSKNIASTLATLIRTGVLRPVDTPILPRNLRFHHRLDSPTRAGRSSRRKAGPSALRGLGRARKPAVPNGWFHPNPLIPPHASYSRLNRLV